MPLKDNVRNLKVPEALSTETKKAQCGGVSGEEEGYWTKNAESDWTYHLVSVSPCVSVSVFVFVPVSVPVSWCMCLLACMWMWMWMCMRIRECVLSLVRLFDRLLSLDVSAETL